MKVSVIIPIYNRLKHLRAGFLCLLRQTIAPDELIITDDGSSEKIENYVEKMVKESKKGQFLLGRAQNTVFEEKEQILKKLEKQGAYENIIKFS